MTTMKKIGKTKRLLSLFLAVMMLLGIVPAFSVTSKAANFTPRTTAPSYSDRYWINTAYGGLNECILISGNSCLPNCVGYAWGRAYEILGSRPRLAKTNANTWYNYTADGYARGSTPKVGSIVCWNFGQYGHVAVVEKVYSNTSIDISESSYNGARFKYLNINPYTANPGLQGYIYLGDFNEGYCLDVNTYVDGTAYNGGYPGITFDVRLNGAIVSNDVQDFYQQVNAGTNYAVIDIKIPTRYVLTGALDVYGNYAGTINSKTDVKLSVITPKLAKTAYFEGRKYEFYKASTSWDSARRFAEAKGGYLATITSQTEQNFISNNNTVGACWLGARNDNTAGQWRWVTGETWNYTNWNSGEPNNNLGSCVDGEHFLGSYNNNKWNDYPWFSSIVSGFIVEYKHTHTWNSGKVTTAATCTSAGKRVYTCTSCGATKTETISARGHKYVSQSVPATCVSAGGTKYTCSVCNYSYIKAENYTEWSETKPVGIPEDKIETKVQYSYSDYVTKVSTDSSMSGYSLINSEWRQTDSGRIYYVSSWPSGFNSSTSMFAKYNKSPKSASISATKRVTTSTANAGYIYWHWCRGQYVSGGPINRLINDGYSSKFPTFHCFESTSSYPHTDPYGVYSDTFYCSNPGCCMDTYWYFRVQVKQQDWKEETKYNTFARWTDYSAWSTTPVSESSTRRVKTRTLYRTESLGEHNFSKKVTPSTRDNEGAVKTVCTVCGKVTESTPIPQIKTVKLSKRTHAYTGKTVTPKVTVKDSEGKTLELGKDYTVEYRNNRKIGKATAVVTFKGDYEGTVTLSFKIVPHAPTVKVTAGKKKATVKWNAVKGATSYTVYYSKSKNSGFKKVGVTTGKTLTVKKLKTGSNRYFKVVANRKVGGKIYSSYSSTVKKARIK